MMLLLEPRKALRKLTKTCRSAKFAILLPWSSGAVAWNLAYEIPYRILSLCLRPACFTAITNYILEVKFGWKYWTQSEVCHIAAILLVLLLPSWNLAYEIPYRILSLCLRPACFTTTKNYSLEVKFGLKYWAKCLICHIVAMVLWHCCLELKTAVCQQNPKYSQMFCLDFSSRALSVPKCISCNSSSPKLRMPIVWKDTMAIIIIICCETHD